MADKTNDEPTAAGWPGGWYVYENGKVDGPFTAADAFGLEADAQDGSPRLVSRKGFTQWYALRDLSEIFRTTERLGKSAAAHGLISEAQLAQLMPGGQPTAKSEAPSTPPKVRPKQVSLKAEVAPHQTSAVTSAQSEAAAFSKPWASTPGTESAFVAKSTAPTPSTSASPPVSERALGASSSGRFADTARRAKVPPLSEQRRTLKPNQLKTPAPRAQVARERQALMQEYFLARGRLRLGKLRNPVLTAFLGLPLSLGLLWAAWFHDVSREVAFHENGQTRSTLPPAIFALVPVLHIWMIFKLAKMIAYMESQNKYRATSPAMAAFLAVIPPFALAYLQNALNKHWMLHAKHGLVKRQAAAQAASSGGTYMPAVLSSQPGR